MASFRDKVISALSVIPADDRDTWVRMAFAVKNGLGDDGFSVWDSWSRTSSRYQERAARSTWRNAKPYGKVTVRSLFAVAQQHGWSDGGYEAPPPVDRMAKQRSREVEREQQQRWAEVAQQAQQMLDEAVLDNHPYLAKKGFPDHRGFVREDSLLVPVRSVRGRLQTLQTIQPDGTKRFLPGGQAGGGVHRIGERQGRFRWYVEGYATGLAVVEALRALQHLRRSEVVITFSAAGIVRVAKLLGAARTKAFAVIDHDPYVCSCHYRWYADWGADVCPRCGSERISPPAGEYYARKAGMHNVGPRGENRIIKPPDPGDADDWYMEEGGPYEIAEAIKHKIGMV